MKFAIRPKYKPTLAMEWVIVILSFVQFAYTFSPLYTDSVAVHGLGPFATALAHPAIVALFVSGLFITAVIMIYGLMKDSAGIRATGLFIQCLLRLYHVLTTLLVAGVTPFVWIYPAAIVLFCAILWHYERGVAKGHV